MNHGTHQAAASAASPTSIPAAEKGVQYNFCKNPLCSQYGIVPSQPHKRGVRGMYAFVSGGKDMPLLRCNACRETPPLKSNAGITEELERLSSYLTTQAKPSCSTTECANNGIPVGTPKAYRSFGTSKSGARRYQCAKCRATLSIPSTTRYQHETENNEMIFRLLVNKSPLSRIIEVLEISWSVLYHRIDFIHRQCILFAAEQERKLRDLEIDRLYLGVDRQAHLVNWTGRDDKRNVTLSAIASADNKTGYVFGVHVNFDPSLDQATVENDAASARDAYKRPPYKKYARLWSQEDYTKSVQRSRARALPGSGTLEEKIKTNYAVAVAREDIEAYDEKHVGEKLPQYGVQIHAEYTMIAHFYFLKRLLGRVSKWRFFLDQESGIRAAVLAAFESDVKQCTADVFYVQIEKEMTVDEKHQLLNQAKCELENLCKKFPYLTKSQAQVEIIKDRIRQMQAIGPFNDRWLVHPTPTMSEPNKRVCWLTPHYEFDEDHIANLYNKASLHAVDTFFEKVRRRIHLLERPISSSANAGRTWHGYAAYNPGLVVKVLDVFRVVHNYVDIQKGGGKKAKADMNVQDMPLRGPTTAAMRLGLATKRFTYADILNFEPS